MSPERPIGSGRGESYRGRDISVMEITLPAAGELVSTAKLTAYKPTIFITGRQHANEVSSTSHILRLGELLLTDPAYKAILKKVNVVLHPVENPDGAAMAYELQKLTPTHMLHAGRYSALGMDVQSQVGQADPLLPEALVRTRVWREWLPDIYLNPHGYPSHEWVQQFAGYVPPGFRSYLSTRGWWTSVNALRDPRYPEHARVVDLPRPPAPEEAAALLEVSAEHVLGAMAATAVERGEAVTTDGRPSVEHVVSFDGGTLHFKVVVGETALYQVSALLLGEAPPLDPARFVGSFRLLP